MKITIKKYIKILKLKWSHDCTYIKRHLGKWISYVVMIMSVAMFILALGSNIAHRLPILSFFAKEMKLPYIFEVSGKVCILNKEEEISIPVNVYIGGYSAHVKSGEQYEIKFTAIDRKDIPVVIRFIYEDEEYTKVEYMDYDDKYNLMCDYKYILGD